MFHQTHLSMDRAQTLLLIGCLLQGVLCQDWRATMPQSIEALSGSCATIPCSFTNPKDYDADLNSKCIGIWRKGSKDGPDLFNSSSNSDSRGTTTGLLTNKDCTTVLNDTPATGSGLYFFRIQCDTRLIYTFLQTVNIIFNDTPPKPSLTPSSVNVTERTSVSLTCSAAVLCPTLTPSLTWTPSLGDSQKYTVQTNITTSVLTITATPLHNGLNISCTASYQQQADTTLSSETSLTINVLYAPRNTSASVSPPGPVLEGSSVTLTCSSDANPAVDNYTWYRVDGNLNSTVISKHNLSFNEISSSNSGDYFCVALNKHGKGKSRNIKVNVQSVPKILSSSNCAIVGDHMNCSCESSGRPSPTLQWRLGGVPVNHSTDTPIRYDPLNSMGPRSFISMRKTENNTRTLICLSRNSVGSASLQYCVHGVTASGGQVSLSFFTPVVVFLSLALILCSVMFIQRVCIPNRRQTNSKMSDADVNQALGTGNAPEEAIYVNSMALREGAAENQGLASGEDSLSKSSIDRTASDKDTEKEEDDCDVLYSSVIWKKKKKSEETNRDDSVDVAASTGSSQEVERCELGNVGGTHLSKSSEVEILYDEFRPKKDEENSVNCEYAQVNIKKKDVK